MQWSIKSLNGNTQKNRAFTAVAQILSDHTNSYNTMIWVVQLREELGNEDSVASGWTKLSHVYAFQ